MPIGFMANEALGLLATALQGRAGILDLIKFHEPELRGDRVARSTDPEIGLSVLVQAVFDYVIVSVDVEASGHRRAIAERVDVDISFVNSEVDLNLTRAVERISSKLERIFNEELIGRQGAD